MRDKILIIDDESKIRMILQSLLEDEGYLTKAAADGETGLALMEVFNPDLIILDMKMPGLSGEETLRQMVEMNFQGKVVILTAFGSIPNAVQAIHSGAYDYVTKPFDTDELLVVINRAITQVRTEKELRSARILLEENCSIEGIITNNPRMKKLLEKLKRAALSDIPILIEGASGTGKELFAKAVHQYSGRNQENFVALNCGAIPESLIESELFGYLRGAFSGANLNKKGMFEEADGGILFLDEIGEMNLNAQVKLLRFAQSGEFVPLGSTKTKRVNVRLVAATNKSLAQAVKNKTFREDLYYRLNAVTIEIPVLAARTGDIPLLVNHFLNCQKTKYFSEVESCSPEAMKLLQSYNWPGNVRELENVIAGAVALTTHNILEPSDLPEKLKLYKAPEFRSAEEHSLHDVISSQKEIAEKNIIIEALNACDHNQTKTAEYLGIGRRTLIRRLNKYGIK